MQNSGLYLLYREINLLRHGGDTSIPCDIMYWSHFQQQRVSKIHTELRIRRNLLIHEQPRFLWPVDFDISVTNFDVLFYLGNNSNVCWILCNHTSMPK